MSTDEQANYDTVEINFDDEMIKAMAVLTGDKLKSLVDETSITVYESADIKTIEDLIEAAGTTIMNAVTVEIIQASIDAAELDGEVEE